MLRFQLTSSVMMRYHTFSSNNWETMIDAFFLLATVFFAKGESK